MRRLRMTRMPNICADRLSQRCLELKALHGLTQARGRSSSISPAGTAFYIAEESVIPENTVRTHSKHIYTKLSTCNKRQEILDIDAL